MEITCERATTATELLDTDYAICNSTLNPNACDCNINLNNDCTCNAAGDSCCDPTLEGNSLCDLNFII